MSLPAKLRMGALCMAFLIMLEGCNSPLSSVNQTVGSPELSGSASPSNKPSSAGEQNGLPSVTSVDAQTSGAANSTLEEEVSDLQKFVRSVPRTPTQYVQAYLDALSSQSGFLARAYLADSIQHQIPARPVIGATPWISKWTLAQLPAKHGTYVFQATGYAAVIPGKPSDAQSWVRDLTATITVESVDGDNKAPWIVSAQHIQFPQHMGF